MFAVLHSQRSRQVRNVKSAATRSPNARFRSQCVRIEPLRYVFILPKLLIRLGKIVLAFELLTFYSIMRLTGISNHGLLVIAALVMILWGCIFAERAITRQAREETLLFLRSRGTAPLNTPVKEQRKT